MVPYPPSHAPKEDPPDPTPEPDTSVEDWRMARLVEAGYPDGIALLLSEHRDVDLHRACDLLAKGCDPMTAWRILT